MTPRNARTEFPGAAVGSWLPVAVRLFVASPLLRGFGVVAGAPARQPLLRKLRGTFSLASAGGLAGR